MSIAQLTQLRDNVQSLQVERGTANAQLNSCSSSSTSTNTTSSSRLNRSLSYCSSWNKSEFSNRTSAFSCCKWKKMLQNRVLRPSAQSDWAAAEQEVTQLQLQLCSQLLEKQCTGQKVAQLQDTIAALCIMLGTAETERDAVIANIVQVQADVIAAHSELQSQRTQFQQQNSQLVQQNSDCNNSCNMPTV